LSFTRPSAFHDASEPRRPAIIEPSAVVAVTVGIFAHGVSRGNAAQCVRNARDVLELS